MKVGYGKKGNWSSWRSGLKTTQGHILERLFQKYIIGELLSHRCDRFLCFPRVKESKYGLLFSKTVAF